MLRLIAILAGIILSGLTAVSQAHDRAALDVALEQARLAPSAETVAPALDLCYRNDAWREGVGLADEHTNLDTSIDARRARALWRAGRLEEAIELITTAMPDNEPLAAVMTVKAAAASADREALRRALARVEGTASWTPDQAQALMSGRIALNDFRDLGPLLKAVLADIEPLEGYPAKSMKEYLQGMPEYFSAMENVRLNETRRYGSASMRPAAFTGLALCEVEINGSGPYRLVVDTGGSIVISLDSAIAEELELKSIAAAQIRGVNGVQESGQSTLEAVRIGEIEMSNVMARTFDMPAVLRGVADGVLGTGIFAGARLTLEFSASRMRIEPSGSAPPADASEVSCWLMGDRKLFTRVDVNGRSLMAVVDTGADVFALSPQWMKAYLAPESLQSTRVAMAGGVGETIESQQLWFGPPVDVTWGGRRFAETASVGLDAFETILGPVLGAQSEALIGMPLLRHAEALIVDFGQARLWLRWKSNPDDTAGTGQVDNHSHKMDQAE